MPNDDWFQRKASKLTPRDWQDISSDWQSHIPSVDIAGKPPDDGVEELVQLSIELKKVPTNNLLDIHTPVAGLRETLLHEGVFVLHKAAHIAAAAQVHISRGMCTWSVSSAYQSAVCSAKAILHFLGVFYLQKGGPHYIVDVWPQPRKKGRRRKMSGNFIRAVESRRIESRHVWMMFKRVLSVTANTSLIVDDKCRDALISIDYSEFGSQRNAIHYRSREWPGNDLHECVRDQRFGSLRSDRLSDHLDPMRDDFTVALCLVLVRTGVCILRELSQTSVVMVRERDLLLSWLSKPESHLYDAAFQREAKSSSSIDNRSTVADE